MRGKEEADSDVGPSLPEGRVVADDGVAGARGGKGGRDGPAAATRPPQHRRGPPHADAALRAAGVVEAVAERVALVVTELVTNAVVHARTEVDFVVDVDGATVRVGVGDGRTRSPVPRSPTIADRSGRGMLLVHAFASRWGVDPRPAGKTVWAEFDVDGP